jgi:hypothetical protein
MKYLACLFLAVALWSTMSIIGNMIACAVSNNSRYTVSIRRGIQFASVSWALFWLLNAI